MSRFELGLWAGFIPLLLPFPCPALVLGHDVWVPGWGGEDASL